MAINIKPDISLSAKPPATMTLPEMIGLARSAQAYQREQEIFPELVQQSKIQTQQSQFTLDKDQTAVAMSLLGGFRNDPRIESGDQAQALNAMEEIRSKALSLGIPQPKVDATMRMGFLIAERNPTKLGQYFDNVIQSQIGPTGQQQLQTPELTTSGGQIGLFRKGPGTITQPKVIQTQEAPSAPPPAVAPAPAAAPAAAPQVGTAPKGVTSADMVASRNDLALLCHTQYAEQVIFAHSLLAKKQQLLRVKPILKTYQPLDQLRQQVLIALIECCKLLAKLNLVGILKLVSLASWKLN